MPKHVCNRSFSWALTKTENAGSEYSLRSLDTGQGTFCSIIRASMEAHLHKVLGDAKNLSYLVDAEFIAIPQNKYLAVG